ncbi:hypothetical protein V565_072830 [Rhizoctonia solani 123E]|uniref:Uncharacterized protein n=1 Tax=Rhizoctonia solani 123E TaxID=1423351 RepID=A0A074SLB3_9AGAM|nr:hypothetical protein V565_072830 [Rhizoctonia solani 123E]
MNSYGGTGLTWDTKITEDRTSTNHETMFSTNAKTPLFGSEHLKQLLGYIVAPHQWRIPSGEGLGRLFTKALEGYHTGLVTMADATATIFQGQHDGQADAQYNENCIVNEGPRDSVRLDNSNLNNIESAPVETLLDAKGGCGFIPRPLRLGSICGSSQIGIRARPLSFQPDIDTMSAQRTLEEKKRQRNSTGSVGMSEWLAQLHAGVNPYVDQGVMQSVAGTLHDTEHMSPPITPTTPSLMPTSSSTSPASTPPTTPPTSPGPVSQFNLKQTRIEVDVLSAFPLPPSTVQWKTLPTSLPGRLETIVEEASATSGDRRRRARCSYTGGKYDKVVVPTIPQELISEEIGVAC